MNVTFKAFEYTSDDKFILAEYKYDGNVTSGWRILKNNHHYLSLGKGYKLLKSRSCGICSTDIARRFYPYPLPQITGHEIVTENPETNEKCVVEINDTPYYRGDQNQDIFCTQGLFTHSPGRMVLGIDRLPGGFGPYILAPKNAIIPYGDLNEYAAVLIEPFAAAFQAITASSPEDGDSVAVLGPRRLGSLLIAALAAFRRTSGKKFKIYALARHKNLLDLCLKLGADTGINIATIGDQKLRNRFDIIYDTTGSESGFELALRFAKREVHLKSTNGLNVCGLDNLTGFVVDELSLLPFNNENLEFTWKNDKRKNSTLYKAPGVDNVSISKKIVFNGDITEADKVLSGPKFADRLPRFDIAVASSLEEIDKIIRPSTENENSLVRPRGAILFKGDPGNNPLLDFILKGGKLCSSRCGNFHTALDQLQKNKDIADNLAHYVISHVFPVHELNTAFEYAKKSSSLKAIVKHGV